MAEPFYQSSAPPVKTHGADLPQWAKIYRTALMVCHTIGLIFIAIVIIGYTVHFEPGMNGKSQLAWILLFLWISFIVTAIPYVIANIVYAVLWLVSLRGKGYRAGLASSIYVTLPPLLIATLVTSWLLIAYTS